MTGRKSPPGTGRAEFLCARWSSLVTGTYAFPAKGGTAWKGDTSHVLAFPLGSLPRPVRSRVKRRRELGH